MKKIIGVFMVLLLSPIITAVKMIAKKEFKEAVYVFIGSVYFLIVPVILISKHGAARGLLLSFIFGVILMLVRWLILLSLPNDEDRISLVLKPFEE